MKQLQCLSVAMTGRRRSLGKPKMAGLGNRKDCLRAALLAWGLPKASEEWCHAPSRHRFAQSPSLANVLQGAGPAPAPPPKKRGGQSRK